MTVNFNNEHKSNNSGNKMYSVHIGHTLKSY